MEAGSPANPKIRLLSNCALVLGCDIEDLIEPVWRKWAPLSPQATKQPSVKAVAEAQDASFKQAGGLPPAQNFPTPMSAEERRRREVLSGRAREREARKRRAREQGK
ncbi:MAG: hypothetical protein JWP75_3045 [Frondihabitans sp.]|nr:hypothetical protein [Frondihabitans sp.]